MDNFRFATSARHQELKCLHPERTGESLNVVNGDVPRLLFDMGNECAMQPRVKRQGFLRQAVLTAQTKQICGKQCARIGSWMVCLSAL